MSLELWNEEVPYALEGEEQPQLTPYLLEGSSKPTAAVIVFPGGGYHHRAKHEGGPVAEWLNGLGIQSFVLDYRVAPYQHPAPLLDAQRAIRYVRSQAEEWNIDPDRIGILGFSAGGHLAATAGTQSSPGRPDAKDPVERFSSRPDLMVLCYPVISFLEYAHQGSIANLLGPGAAEEQKRALSAEQQVGPDTPPTFLWHTSEDASVPVENSLFFAAALSKHKIPFDLHVFQAGRHGLGLAADQPESRTWTELCSLWLKKQGYTAEG